MYAMHANTVYVSTAHSYKHPLGVSGQMPRGGGGLLYQSVLMYFISFSPYSRLVDAGGIPLMSAAEELKVKTCLLGLGSMSRAESVPSLHLQGAECPFASLRFHLFHHSSNGSESVTDIGNLGLKARVAQPPFCRGRTWSLLRGQPGLQGREKAVVWETRLFPGRCDPS